DYSLLLVEGARSNFARLRRQLTQNGRLASRITLHHGLVGKQTGVGNLNEGEIHYGSHVAEQEGQGTYQVSYLNLDELFSSYPTIHFLKCDIEGSEGDFIMNYPDLLRKTRHICVETHSAKLFKLCSQRLHELGFSPPEVLSQLEHEGLQQTTFSCVRRPSR
ncbi:MAG: FkbM family methyltransferase, partial [Bdellovibrionales bacterium]|nr:FkbM family methyltransferase [Bdellovibrionales bacterium]